MDLSTQAVASILFSEVLQYVKRSPYFPAVTAEKDKLNKWITVAASGLMAFGITAACNHADKSCTVTVSWMGALAGLKAWGIQWAMAHGWYKATK